MVLRRRQRLEIGTHAERAIAGTGDDRDVKIGIRRIQVEGPCELVVRFRMQRVQHFGTIDRDRHDRAIALEPAVLEYFGCHLARQ